MTPREIILIIAGKSLSSNELETAARQDLKKAKRWLNGMNVKFEGFLQKPKELHHKKLEGTLIIYGINSLELSRQKLSRCNSSPVSLIVIINSSDIYPVFDWLNKNVTDMPSSVLSGQFLNNISIDGVIRVATRETRARDKGVVEIFWPN
jgi:hypothetical protein